MLETLDRKLISPFFNLFFGDIIMTLKYTKPLKILVLFFIIALLVVPAVSAQSGADNSGKKADPGATDDSYIVTPAEESSPSNSNSIISAMSTQYIGQGQTIVHQISTGPTRRSYIEVDLNWGDKSDSLTLTVYSPSGCLGTYNDKYDGVVNGRIHINIKSPKGYIEPNQIWKFNVCGASVRGTEDYTFNAALH